MKIIIKKYSLSNPYEYNDFIKYRNDLIYILKESYSDLFFGEKEFIKRIELKKLNIVLAFAEANSTPIGTLIYKNSGKGSALAVLEEYRKYQVAKKLLDYVKNNVKYFFAEISTNNIFLQKFLLINNFKIVSNTITIKKNLGQEKDKIKFLFQEDKIYYYHIKFKRSIDKVRTFIMFEYTKK